MTDAQFRELAEYLAFDWVVREFLKSEQTAACTGLDGSTPGGASTRLASPPGLLAL